MIKSIFNGFNIFKKKIELLYTFIVYAIFTAYTFFVLNYTSTISEKIDMTGISLINYPEYIIHTLGWNFLGLLLAMFGTLLLLSYLTTVISNTENKRKLSFIKGFCKSFKFSILAFIIIIVFMLIFMVLSSYINVITVILMILLAILIIYLILIFTIANINLGLFNMNVKEAIKKSRLFLRKKFWHTIGFLILIFVIYFIFYLLIDNIYFLIFTYNTIAAIIVNEIFMLVITLYILNALTLFVKSQRFS
jgi:hypothetical protein